MICLPNVIYITNTQKERNWPTIINNTLLKDGAERKPETVGEYRREPPDADVTHNGGLQVQDGRHDKRHGRNGENEAQPEVVPEWTEVDEQAIVFRLLHDEHRRAVPEREGEVDHLLPDIRYCELRKTEVRFL